MGKNIDAMPVVSGYSMIIYCQCCMAYEELTSDGGDCYYWCRRRARKHGWILHKDGFATCGNCSPNKK